MRDIIFQELREAARSIENIKDTEQRRRGNELLIDSILQIIELASISKNEGLLAVEEKVYELQDTGNGKYLKSMIQHVTDGFDSEMLEDLFISRYFSANFTGFVALQYIIMLIGSLAIQTGENPRIIEEQLVSCLPIETEAFFYEKKKENGRKADTRRKIEIEEKYATLGKYYVGDIAASFEDDGYVILSAVDYAICNMDDSNIQRLLRDVDNMDLAIALKGLSGNARKRIFFNHTKRLAVMITEDMEFLGELRISDYVNAADRIRDIILRLSEKGEIVCPNLLELRLLSEMDYDFDKDDDDKSGLHGMLSQSEINNLLNSVDETSEKDETERVSHSNETDERTICYNIASTDIVECPICHKEFDVTEAYLGDKKCPYCLSELKIEPFLT